MSTLLPPPPTTATTRHPDPHAGAPDGRKEPPERLPITAAVLRAFRRHGWTIAEQRSGGWQYLILRGHEQSAVYKLVGPLFDNTGSRYEGFRIA